MIDQDDWDTTRPVIQLGQFTILGGRDSTDLAVRAVITLGKCQPSLLAVTKILVGAPTATEGQADEQQDNYSLDVINF